ncbi:MAG: hypothetical protein KAX16_02830, partial [Actinomycetia bacterium]|nr:hypothetical protein [Actinomycetes bacterium]
MNSKTKTVEAQTWMFLMVFRGISILFAAVSVAIGYATMAAEPKIWVIIGASFLYTLFLVRGFRFLSQLLHRYPVLILLDVFVSFSFLYLTGPDQSPFLFYSIAPVVTISLIYGFKRGFMIAAVSMVAYVGSTGYNSSFFSFTSTNFGADDFTAFSSYFSGFVFFSILGSLRRKLSENNRELVEMRDNLALANKELKSANRQLVTLQDINDVFQSYRDLPSTIDTVLNGIKYGLDFDRVIVGLVGQQPDVISRFTAVGGAGAVGQRDVVAELPALSGTKIEQVFSTNEPASISSQEDARSL